AAHRIGIAQRGSGDVIVETVLPGALLAAATPPAATRPALTTLPAAEAAPTAVPVRQDASGTYLQLGAFANYSNAENFLEHVQSQVVWLGETASVSQRDGLYRVQMGPYPDAQEARRIAELV